MIECKDISTLTKYISVWGWHLTGMVFLCASFIMFALPRTLITKVFYISLFILFGVAEILSHNRRKELENEQ